MSGIYSIYLQNAGEAVGSGGAILYTTDKIYSLDLAPAIATVRGNSDSPYFGGWIVIDGSGDPIFTQYYSKPTKDDSPLSVTGAPFNAPSNEGHARMVEITSSDSDLIQKVTIAFEEALATAKQRVIAKLKTVSKKDADLAVKDLSPCSGILKIADE